MSTTTMLRLSAVTKRFISRFETVTALDDVSLTLEGGEVVGLVGPSGSGKTTLLHLVMGWEPADDGAIERRPDVAADWSGLAVVPQELGLLPELTARQNVELAGRLGGSLVEPVADLLEQLALDELADRLPEELSLGEQQRVSVARGLVCAPRVLVADEPTAHQDEERADLVMEALRRVADRGGAVLVATHDERLLADMDRVVRILDGRIVDR